MATDDGLRNIPEAADWLGISVSLLEKLVAARKVPHTRIGMKAGAVRFAQHHLNAIVAAGEQPVIPAPIRRVGQIRLMPTPPSPPPPNPSRPPPTPPQPAGPSSPPPPPGPKVPKVGSPRSKEEAA